MIQSLFYGLRPAVAALIVTAASGIFISSLLHMDADSQNPFAYINYIAVALFVLCYLINRKYKPHPIFIICLMAVVGIVLQL